MPGLTALEPKALIKHTLEHALQTEPARLQQITLQSFTQTLLRVLLTNPEDDKRDDYFLIPAEQASCFQLWRIDNERAYYQPNAEKTGLFSVNRRLQVKSALFCLDQMLWPLAREVIHDFLKLNPYSLLESWLEDLQHQHQLYRKLFTIKGEGALQGDIAYHINLQEPGPSLLVMAIGEGLIKELYNRLNSMQTVLRLSQKNKQAATGLDLLNAVQPALAEHYAKRFMRFPVQKNQPSLAYNRFKEVTRGLYQTSQSGHQQSTMPGLLAISQSLRLPALDERLAIHIAEGEINSPLQALDELHDINQSGRVLILREQLLGGLPEGLEAYKKLSTRLQLVILRDIMYTLEPAGSYFYDDELPPIKDKLPNKPSLEQQRIVLQAIAGIPFHQLCLTPFKSVLDETLLFPILQGAGQHLLALDISGCSLLTNRTLQQLQQVCPNLQDLALQDLDNPNRYLIDSRNKVVAVEGTFAHLCRLKASGCKQLQILRFTAPLLSSLEANDCPELVTVWVASEQNFSVHFNDCEKLERTLDLRDKGLTASSVPSIAQKIARQHVALTVLDLNYNRIGAEGAKALALALEKNTTLTQLNMSYNQLGNEGEKAYGLIKAYLARNRLIHEPNQTKLNIWSDKIGAEGAKALALAVEKNTILTNLGLYNNQIGDEGAKGLALALEKNTSLTELDLSLNSIGDEGAKALALALEKNTTLIKLALEYNQIRGSMLESISRLTQRNKQQHETRIKAIQLGQIDDLQAFTLSSLLHLRDENGLSIYHIAAERGQLAVLEWLEKQCAKHQLTTPSGYNLRDEEGNTPLHLAYKNGYVTVIQYLLQQGALPDSRNRAKQLALPEEARAKYQVVASPIHMPSAGQLPFFTESSAQTGEGQTSSARLPQVPGSEQPRKVL